MDIEACICISFALSPRFTRQVARPCRRHRFVSVAPIRCRSPLLLRVLCRRSACSLRLRRRNRLLPCLAAAAGGKGSTSQQSRSACLRFQVLRTTKAVPAAPVSGPQRPSFRPSYLSRLTSMFSRREMMACTHLGSMGQTCRAGKQAGERDAPVPSEQLCLGLEGAPAPIMRPSSRQYTASLAEVHPARGHQLMIHPPTQRYQQQYQRQYGASPC
jgi:hypothetical protein